MDREHIAEHLLVERYLQDGLSAEEQAAFEEAFLSSEDLLDQLESAEMLRQGLNDVATLEQAQPAGSKPSWFVSMFNSPRYAMAASFLLLVSLGVSSSLLHQLGQGDGAEFSISPTQIVPLVSVRGAPGDPSVNTLRIGAGNEQMVLMLDPGFEQYSHYRASVFRLQAGSEPAQVMQVDGLQPGYEEMLALALSARALVPGDYQVTIEGWREEWPADHAFDRIDTVPLRVVAPSR
jgi:hypothetical protein